MSTLVAPSILAADFSRLGEAISMINTSDADWVHCDVMDGAFVPNISFGFPVLEAVRDASSKPLDVHLMIERPERFVKEFKAAGAYMLTVHYEACQHLHRVIEAIKNEEMQAGIALNPHTPVSEIEEILPYADMILVMSVNPGYGGQKFIPSSFRKVQKVRAMAQELGVNPMIQVDGGVDPSNAQELVAAGANVLVAGSSVFKASDPHEAIRQLKDAEANNVQV
jgi:ribulose-phosphate 3-epimerase